MRRMFKAKLSLLTVAVILMMALLCSTAFAEGANTLYVDASAETEGADGTLQKPYQTIQRLR